MCDDMYSGRLMYTAVPQSPTQPVFFFLDGLAWLQTGCLVPLLGGGGRAICVRY